MENILNEFPLARQDAEQKGPAPESNIETGIETISAKMQEFFSKVASYFADLPNAIRGKKSMAIIMVFLAAAESGQAFAATEQPFYPSQQPPQPAAGADNFNPKNDPQYMLEPYKDPANLFATLFERKDNPPPPVSGGIKMPNRQAPKLVDLGQ